MKTMTKLMTGAVATATMAVALPAPAAAQYGRYDPYYRSRDRGVDAGDIITGVAVLGGIAAIMSAIDNDGSRYGYGNRYRYRDDYRGAVNACAYQAERYGRGRVQVTDVDRRGSYSYRVRGVIQGGGYGGYGYDGYGDRYSGRNYGGEAFTCTARGDGRVTNFRINNRGYGSRW